MPKPEITTRAYERSHMKAPRGRGGWLFAPATNWTAFDRDIKWSQMKNFNGTYAEARKAAREHFHGNEPYVAVLP